MSFTLRQVHWCGFENDSAFSTALAQLESIAHGWKSQYKAKEPYCELREHPQVSLVGHAKKNLSNEWNKMRG
jgi:hypothetical protein